jgi:hypothetical protein
MKQIQYARRRGCSFGVWHIFDGETKARCGVKIDPQAGSGRQRWEIKADTEMEGQEFLRLCPNCASAGLNKAVLYSAEVQRQQAEEAIGESLTHHSHKHGGAAVQGASDRWRNRRITGAQKDKLNALGVSAPTSESWTRGRASDEIDRLLGKQEEKDVPCGRRKNRGGSSCPPRYMI